MLLGLTSNLSLGDVHLDLSSNELRNPGAQVLEAVIGYLHNVSSLDISNNGGYLCYSGENCIIKIKRRYNYIYTYCIVYIQLYMLVVYCFV